MRTLDLAPQHLHLLAPDQQCDITRSFDSAAWLQPVEEHGGD
jgi:hypothetical protein